VAVAAGDRFGRRRRRRRVARRVVVVVVVMHMYNALYG
jgi:hypothetical protein